MNKLPEEIINIIDAYVKDFESAQMINYVIERVVHRANSYLDSQHPLDQGISSYLIHKVEREMENILRAEERNLKNRVKTRTRPVTYKKHIRFLNKDWICGRRMEALSTTIEFLRKEWQHWEKYEYKNTEIYKAFVKEFGDPVPLFPLLPMYDLEVWRKKKVNLKRDLVRYLNVT